MKPLCCSCCETHSYEKSMFLGSLCDIKCLGIDFFFSSIEMLYYGGLDNFNHFELFDILGGAEIVGQSIILNNIGLLSYFCSRKIDYLIVNFYIYKLIKCQSKILKWTVIYISQTIVLILVVLFMTKMGTIDSVNFNFYFLLEEENGID